MKKTILSVAIISALLVSCNETKHKDNKTLETTEVSNEHLGEDMLSHATDNSWINEIKLNSGKKWDANFETTDGVEKMIVLTKESSAKSVTDYHALASNLNEVKNYIVKKCTMDGPSHDNLHVFLHPLIEKIDALGKVSNEDDGAKIKESIIKNLEGYYDYFK
jgi:hypothetical protein